ncbi:hypothetical protein Syun_001079 [Stephania yunnanensis]|uniref:Uncharacterized protein n=1 Tax=Stephania yunnanensis TaxID=152371 RepID=A0AAP0Q7E0_9MAGN
MQSLPSLGYYRLCSFPRQQILVDSNKLLAILIVRSSKKGTKGSTLEWLALQGQMARSCYIVDFDEPLPIEVLGESSHHDSVQVHTIHT